MPPSLRRRAPSSPRHFARPGSDSENEGEVDDILEDEEVEGEEIPDEEIELDGEDDGEEEDDEPLPSPSSLIPTYPIPPNFREISTLASWTVSSSKPGCSIPQLRNPSTSLFWQSDGPQPHYLNIHFFKLVRIVGLRLFLDFDADESYTPTRIIFLAGSGGNDLVEWGEMKLEQPRGWVWADFDGVGEGSSSEDEADYSEEELENQDHEADVDIADLARPFHANDSDSENAQPGSSRQEPSDPVTLNPRQRRQQRRQHQAQPQQQSVQDAPHLPPNTGLHQDQPFPRLHQNSTPSMPRPHPRAPLSNLTPNASPHLPQPRQRRVKMPVLRAHLVQIKILENHQNGKDTHLRGLQIFAKDNERIKEGRIGRIGGGFELGSGMGFLNGSGGAGVPRRERIMSNLTKSAWDVEPSIR